jgi:fused signal recognition particle receptor
MDNPEDNNSSNPERSAEDKNKSERTTSAWFRFGKKSRAEEAAPSSTSTDSSSTESTSTDVSSTDSSTVDEGLAPSRKGILAKIGNVFKGTFDLDDELFDELEETLMTCDIGVAASLALVDRLRERVAREKIQDAHGVLLGLRREVAELLQEAEQEWPQHPSPTVILIVGVNGVGKTTTTAKIAHHFKQNGLSVVLAAADTFRAAAVEQLQEWGARLDIPVISQGPGADAAAVAHDALNSARARNADVLLIDTAGRLHTQTDLMEQLQKVLRVLKKIDPDTPHEVLQILDAGTGQNALSQLEHFQKAVNVSGLCLTKLDGSAKGGVALSLTEKYHLPIRFIGVGERIDDLRPFAASEFANALIAVK